MSTLKVATSSGRAFRHYPIGIHDYKCSLYTNNFQKSLPLNKEKPLRIRPPPLASA